MGYAQAVKQKLRNIATTDNEFVIVSFSRKADVGNDFDDFEV